MYQPLKDRRYICDEMMTLVKFIVEQEPAFKPKVVIIDGAAAAIHPDDIESSLMRIKSEINFMESFNADSPEVREVSWNRVHSDAHLIDRFADHD